MGRTLKTERIETAYIGSVGSNAFTITRGGGSLLNLSTLDNVGIGTTSPGSKLTINGGSEVDLKIESTTSVANLGGKITFNLTNNLNNLIDAGGIRCRNSYSTQVAGTEQTYLGFFTRSYSSINERLRITSDGQILDPLGDGIINFTKMTARGHYNNPTTNIAFGSGAFYSSNQFAQFNTAIGASALSAGSAGVLIANTAIGYEALKNTNNQGAQAGQGQQVGSGNVAVGYRALYSNLMGSGNVAIGSEALLLSTNTSNSVAIGTSAMSSPSYISATENVAIGYKSCENLTGHHFNNVAIGARTLQRNGAISEFPWPTLDYNVAIGYLSSNTTRGSYNTAVGGLTREAGSGDHNTALGYLALNQSTGNYNTAVGSNTLRYIINNGSENTALGYYAARRITSGKYNTAVGAYALGNNSFETGEGMTAIGAYALQLLLSASNNHTALGYRAGEAHQGGRNNIFIGVSGRDVGGSNTSSNTIILGNLQHTILKCNAASITTLSDKRDKKDIENLPVGLNFINDLRPVKFKWNQRDGGRVGLDDLGFIAQESLETVDKYNADWMGLVEHQNPEHFEMSPGKLIPVLVKAVQDLKRDFDLYVSGQALKT